MSMPSKEYSRHSFRIFWQSVCRCCSVAMLLPALPSRTSAPLGFTVAHSLVCPDKSLAVCEKAGETSSVPSAAQ